jgi:hypothetical protein
MPFEREAEQYQSLQHVVRYSRGALQTTFDQQFLVVFYEQITREQLDQLRKAGKGASGQIVNGEFTIKPGSHG